MSEPSEVRRDRITGLLGMSVSIAYILQARTIEDSLLADTVGAAGVPIAVAALMLLASLALLLKSAGSASPAAPAAPVDEEPLPAPKPGFEHPHAMAVTLWAILAGYVLILPWIGYVLSIGLLVGSVAWFGGARKPFTLLACMACAGPALWLMFDWALGIRLPFGLWPQMLVRSFNG